MTYPQLQPSPYILRLKKKDKKDRELLILKTILLSIAYKICAGVKPTEFAVLVMSTGVKPTYF